jgi:hypothetical protein
MPLLLPGGASPVLPPDGRRRNVILVLGGAGLAISLLLLQGLFDAGDRRRALAALDSTPAASAGTATLAEVLRQRNGRATPRCTAAVLSATRGITRVRCAVAGDPEPYHFLWDDLRRGALRPEDDATRRRLAP